MGRVEVDFIFKVEQNKKITGLSNGRLSRRLFCGLTRRHHKTINAKFAIYSGVICVKKEFMKAEVKNDPK